MMEKICKGYNEKPDRLRGFIRFLLVCEVPGSNPAGDILGDPGSIYNRSISTCFNIKPLETGKHTTICC